MPYTDKTGMTYQRKRGSRQNVWNGESYCTASGLLRDDLCLNAKNKIVSKKKSLLAKKRYKDQGGFKKLKKVENVEIEVPKKKRRRRRKPKILAEV